MKFTYRPSKGFVISILIILFIVFLSFVLDLYFYERQSSRRIEQEGKLVTKELTLNVETFLREIEASPTGRQNRFLPVPRTILSRSWIESSNSSTQYPISEFFSCPTPTTKV